jgi:alkylation response protein AidB-like acyl-CoA dehydrogenase
MLALNQYRAAEELERYLGDPLDSRRVLSYRRAVELDERDEYPEEACARLDGWKLQDHYVPSKDGGRLESYEQLFALMRVVARRDMTAGLAHATTYAAACMAWVSSTPEQRRRIARTIRDGRQLALGFHETAHGNDLLSCETRATKTARGYVLSGEKWVISNGRRSAVIIIFARTSPEGGPRGFSLLLVEKDGLAAKSYSHLPKFKTHGVRGHDTSGIRFHDCPVAEENLLGGAGSGLETAIKSFQVSRTVFTSLALGAADTALRATLSFALSRGLYGATVFDIPSARETLVGAFLDLLICDCVALTSLRVLHAATGQLSFWSTIAKYFIPTTIDQTVRDLSVVLGARYYLREGHWSGIFQKILRDTPFISLTHNSAVISLSHLVTQLPQLAAYRAKAKAAAVEGGGAERDLSAIFSLASAPPAFEPGDLALNSRGRDDVLEGLAAAPARLRRLKRDGGLDAGLCAEIGRLVEEVSEQAGAFDRHLTGLVSRCGHAFADAPEAFELAHRFCVLHAAAACVQMWLYNGAALGEFFRRGEWLALCLDRLLQTFRPALAPRARLSADNVARELVRLHREDRLFSIVPLQLARTGAAFV